MRNKKKNGSGIIMFIALLVLGVIIYLGASGQLEKMIGKSVFAGVIGTPTPSPVPTDPIKQTVTITMPAVGYYAIQTGVYELSANAFENASQLQKRGAAGYIADDTGRGYRVFAAAYASQKNADVVKNRLQSEEKITSFIYKIGTDGLSVTLTATTAQINAIKAALEAFGRLSERIEDMIYDYDGGGIDTIQLRARLGEMSTECRTVASALSNALRQNGTNPFNGLTGVYTSFADKIDAVKNLNENDRTRVSSQTKYLYIDLICLYCDCLNALK
ncbi:MAG: SPOR domain-containing protein [Eubacteriales bacterium]|nr:SPOR domain-containing protein [Eubacteriales bacterium]